MTTWSGWTTHCGCGAQRSAAADPFFLVPNPQVPSRAGAFLLRTVPRQATESNPRSFVVSASSNNADRCNVRACHQCGALYACPVEQEG